jgi:putative Mn2+ efflux pump MntP
VSWAVIALLASLGLDTLAVAISLGIAGLARSQWIRAGLTFAFFEAVMPVVGLVIGQHLGGVLGELAGYIAAGILIVLGSLEIREALVEAGHESRGTLMATRAGLESEESDAAGLPIPGLTATWRAMVFRGLSVSLDELAIGFSLGILHVPIAPALAYIALQAFGVTFLGLWLGGRVSARLGERTELAAGVLLVLLGIALMLNEATGLNWL